MVLKNTTRRVLSGAVVILVVIVAAMLAVACSNPLVQASKAIQALETTPVMKVMNDADIVLFTGDTVDLGNLGIDTSVDYSLLLLNTGKTALTFDPAGTTVAMAEGTEAGTFTLVSQPSSIAAGSSGIIVVRFNKGAPGTKSAVLTLKTNDVTNVDFKLNLQGVCLEAMTSFRIKTPASDGIISGNDITVFVPNDIGNLTMLVAEFTTTGSQVLVGSTVQVSGTTYHDFTTPITYRVTSLNDESYLDYTVTVIKNPPAPTVTPHDRAIEVSWAPVADASGYEVWYYAANIPEAAVKSGDTVSGTSATIGGLINGTTYYVWIKARYANGNTSGLGLVSAAALVEKKYFGWLYGGDSTGMSRYPISTATGALGAGETVFSHTPGVVAMEIDQAKNFVFFAYKGNGDPNTSYRVNSARIDPTTGTLTMNAEQDTNNSRTAYSLQMAPDGKHLYASQGYIDGGYIYCWDIDQTTGSLGNQRTFAAINSDLSGARGMAINRTKNLLYIVEYFVPAIYICDIDPATGNLSHRSTLTTGEYPFDVAISTNSNRLLVSYNELGVASYALDADGLPTGSPRTNPLTPVASWMSILSFPVKGSSTQDHVFALGYYNLSAGYLSGLSDDASFEDPADKL